MISPRPLDRFSLVDTTDPEETRAALMRIYAKPILEVMSRRRQLRTVVNHCRLKHSGLSYGSYGAELRMRFPETGFASQIFPVRGKSEAIINRTSVAISADRSVVVSPHEDLCVINNSEYERLVLSVSSTALASKLSAITGVSCGSILKFDPVQNYALPAAKALRSHFLFLVGKLGASSPPIPDPVLAEFEQTIIVMFLHANRHNYSHLLEQGSPQVSASQARRTEDYIEANWRQPITFEDLAQVSGAGASGLFQSFRNSRGCSPMQFASRLRLNHARKLLQRPDATTTVADVASTCGFSDLVRFAGDYMRAFGEHPWQTLRRGKGNGPARH